MPRNPTSTVSQASASSHHQQERSSPFRVFRIFRKRASKKPREVSWSSGEAGDSCHHMNENVNTNADQEGPADSPGSADVAQSKENGKSDADSNKSEEEEEDEDDEDDDEDDEEEDEEEEGVEPWPPSNPSLGDEAKSSTSKKKSSFKSGDSTKKKKPSQLIELGSKITFKQDASVAESPEASPTKPSERSSQYSSSKSATPSSGNGALKPAEVSSRLSEAPSSLEVSPTKPSERSSQYSSSKSATLSLGNGALKPAEVSSRLSEAPSSLEAPSNVLELSNVSSLSSRQSETSISSSSESNKRQETQKTLVFEVQEMPQYPRQSGSEENVVSSKLEIYKDPSRREETGLSAIGMSVPQSSSQEASEPGQEILVPLSSITLPHSDSQKPPENEEAVDDGLQPGVDSIQIQRHQKPASKTSKLNPHTTESDYPDLKLTLYPEQDGSTDVSDMETNEENDPIASQPSQIRASQSQPKKPAAIIKPPVSSSTPSPQQSSSPKSPSQNPSPKNQSQKPATKQSGANDPSRPKETPKRRDKDGKGKKTVTFHFFIYFYPMDTDDGLMPFRRHVFMKEASRLSKKENRSQLMRDFKDAFSDRRIKSIEVRCNVQIQICRLQPNSSDWLPRRRVIIAAHNYENLVSALSLMEELLPECFLFARFPERLPGFSCRWASTLGPFTVRPIKQATNFVKRSKSCSFLSSSWKNNIIPSRIIPPVTKFETTSQQQREGSPLSMFVDKNMYKTHSVEKVLCVGQLKSTMHRATRLRSASPPLSRNVCNAQASIEPIRTEFNSSATSNVPCTIFKRTAPDTLTKKNSSKSGTARNHIIIGQGKRRPYRKLTSKEWLQAIAEENEEEDDQMKVTVASNTINILERPRIKRKRKGRRESDESTLCNISNNTKPSFRTRTLKIPISTRIQNLLTYDEKNRPSSAELMRLMAILGCQVERIELVTLPHAGDMSSPTSYYRVKMRYKSMEEMNCFCAYLGCQIRDGKHTAKVIPP